MALTLCGRCRAMTNLTHRVGRDRCPPCFRIGRDRCCGCDTAETAEQAGSFVMLWIVAAVVLTIGILWEWLR